MQEEIIILNTEELRDLKTGIEREIKIKEILSLTRFNLMLLSLNSVNLLLL